MSKAMALAIGAGLIAIVLSWLLLDTRHKLDRLDGRLQDMELALAAAQTRAEEAETIARKLEQSVSTQANQGTPPLEPPLSALRTIDDGEERIAFRSLQNGPSSFFSIRPDGTGLLQHTTGAGGLRSDWSPDGRSLLVEAQGPGGGVERLIVLRADGSDMREVTVEGQEGSWSPDGRQIVFTTFAHGSYNSEVYVIDTDGQNARRLTTNDAPDFAPQFSPDGRRIVFSRYAPAVW